MQTMRCALPAQWGQRNARSSSARFAPVASSAPSPPLPRRRSSSSTGASCRSSGVYLSACACASSPVASARVGARRGRPGATAAPRKPRLQRLSAAAAEAAAAAPTTLDAVCSQLDKILAKAEEDRSQEAAARALVEQAEDKGLLRAFGRARQLPKRLYTIDELRLNKVEPEKLLAPKDESLNRVRNILQGAALAGLGALAYFSGFDVGRVVGTLLGASFALVADQVANAGGGEALIVDTCGRLLDPKYAKRVALHEAGHLLIAYLLGVMPKAYTLSSLDAFTRYRALNIQAGTTFCDTAFEAEVASGRLKGGTLDKYACVALAGVVTEYLRFGQAEGGVGDVAQLDRLMRALNFTQKKADGQVRWAVLNVAMLLRRYSSLQDKLAAAMAAGASVGGCVRLIESELAGDAEGILGPGEAEEAASAFVSSTSGGSTTGGSSAEASQQEP